MDHRMMPSTQLRLSPLCLGTSTFGNGIDYKSAKRLLDRYVALGGNFIDTARVYADWLPGERSSSEKTIGRWLRERGHRDAITVATKGGHPHLSSMQVSRLSSQEIVADLEASLRHLQIDCIDLYYLHRDDPARPVAEIVDTLVEQVTAGKIRYFGCSNWRVERIIEAQTHADRQGVQGFVANQMLWSLAASTPGSLTDPTMVTMDEPMRAYHQASGLAAVAYSSQANGWFQKWVVGRGKGIGAGQQARYGNETNRVRQQRIEQMAREKSLTVTQVVLGYLLSQPFPTFPIVGCRTERQLADSMQVQTVQLNAEEIAFLAAES